MIIHKNLEQGTQEWFDARVGKLTASKASAVASNGKGLETLVFEKVAELLTGQMVMIEQNDAMKRGVELENEARGAYELKTGNMVEQVGFIDAEDGSGCSPDGLIGEDGMLEIKCPTDKVFVQYLFNGKIDSGYMWQMQMQMLVSNRKWVDYVVYNPRFPKPIKIQRVIRDEVKIQKLKAGIQAGTVQIKTILEGVK